MGLRSSDWKLMVLVTSIEFDAHFHDCVQSICRIGIVITNISLEFSTRVVKKYCIWQLFQVWKWVRLFWRGNYYCVCVYVCMYAYSASFSWRQHKTTVACRRTAADDECKKNSTDGTLYSVAAYIEHTKDRKFHTKYFSRGFPPYRMFKGPVHTILNFATYNSVHFEIKNKLLFIHSF
jgi:hypothetical protein